MLRADAWTDRVVTCCAVGGFVQDGSEFLSQLLDVVGQPPVDGFGIDTMVAQHGRDWLEDPASTGRLGQLSNELRAAAKREDCTSPLPPSLFFCLTPGLAAII